MVLVQGYDAPGTVGGAASSAARWPRATSCRCRSGLDYRLEQWAAFSVRYLTAWSRLSRGDSGPIACRSRPTRTPPPSCSAGAAARPSPRSSWPRRAGSRTAMISRQPGRLARARPPAGDHRYRPSGPSPTSSSTRPAIGATPKLPKSGRTRPSEQAFLATVRRLDPWAQRGDRLRLHRRPDVPRQRQGAGPPEACWRPLAGCSACR